MSTETRERAGQPPVQRMPKEWERRPLPMTQESPQGPAVTGKPTMRSLAPIPGDVTTQLQEGDPGGFLAGVLASRPSSATRTAPGDNGNVQLGNGTGEEQARGSATRTMGNPVPPISEQTVGKGTF